MTTTFSQKKKELPNLMEKLSHGVPFQVIEEPNQFSTKLLKSLKGIFDGKSSSHHNLNPRMDRLSRYARRGLKFTSLVQIGYVTTCGATAKVVGGSPKFVGRIEALNPFALLIPCQRVVHSGLIIGGYGIGERVK